MLDLYSLHLIKGLYFITCRNIMHWLSRPVYISIMRCLIFKQMYAFVISDKLTTDDHFYWSRYLDNFIYSTDILFISLGIFMAWLVEFIVSLMLFTRLSIVCNEKMYDHILSLEYLHSAIEQYVIYTSAHTNIFFDWKL